MFRVAVFLGFYGSHWWLQLRRELEPMTYCCMYLSVSTNEYANGKCELHAVACIYCTHRMCITNSVLKAEHDRWRFCRGLSGALRYGIGSDRWEADTHGETFADVQLHGISEATQRSQQQGGGTFVGGCHALRPSAQRVRCQELPLPYVAGEMLPQHQATRSTEFWVSGNLWTAYAKDPGGRSAAF